VSDRALRVAAAVVALAGIGVAGYLAWTHYAGDTAACPIGGSCEEVQESEYAEFLGVPVSLLGLLAYTALLVLLVWDAPVARLAAAALALVGVLFSAYLLVVQLFVIDAVCVWCLANDVLIAPALAVLTALRLRTSGA
jgi:uncharacterized membrane protein